MPEKTMTIDDVAAIFRVSGRTVNRWISNGILGYIRVPGGKRILEEHVSEMLERLKVQSNGMA